MPHGVVTGFVLVGLAAVAAEWLGTWWDLWWHAFYGRDSLFSPPHLVMLGGMALQFAIGAGAFLLARHAVSAAARRAALLVAVLGASQAVALFVVDEAWHRLFGPDAFVLSPPHVLLFLCFAANAALLTALAVRLARHSRPWWSAAWALASLTLGIAFILLAESTLKRAPRRIDVWERHPGQVHPHVTPWVAVLLAVPLAVLVLGALYEIGGRGRRGAALVLGSAVGFPLLGWLLYWLFAGNRASPAAPMLVLAGTLPLAAGLALGEIGAGAGAALFGPALWTAEWWLKTHLAFGVAHNRWEWMALSALAALPALALGRRAGAWLARTSGR